ncbi:hypothetical protein [Marinobacter sp. F3R08]|uniref:hypothetical protein n=1 Tax=Marinobacter sp. F3R08 TaxID=2841559 RepID=UPI001C0A5712|nr:hypothetical protein [Marinobacter sp. F3R08]MBU2952940.1 hypothetical protein [Marinobacter sp. F3R08]
MGKSRSVLMTLILMGTLSACSHAGQPGSSGGKRPSGPPPEAFEACEGLAEGEHVSFAGRGGESLEATCEKLDGKLVAVPENAPRR